MLESSELIKCAIYGRASTGKQEDSIQNQVAQGKEYISRLGKQYDSEDVMVFKDEATSGYYTSVFDRKEMKEAVAAAREGKFKLLVFKEVSRVGRDKQENPAIIGMFEQYGVRVIAINDNYDSLNRDSITFDILSVLSEQESRKISSRVSSAKKQKARRGEWNGEPPIGYKVDKKTKKLIVDEELEYIPKLIFELYVKELMGTFKIAEYLNYTKNIRTREGNLWTRETINRIIRNHAYIGEVVYGTRRNALERKYDDSGKMSKRMIQIKIDKKEWSVMEDCHPALIDKELFYEAQKIITGRSKGGQARRVQHPLTGVLICGLCGSGMVCQKRTYRDKQYRYYICKTYHKYGRSACEQANVDADKLEKAIIETIKNRISSVDDAYFTVLANRSSDINKLESEHAKKIKYKEKLQKDQRDLFSQRDLFTEDAYREQMMQFKAQTITVDEELSIIEEQLKIVLLQLEETSSLNVIIENFKEIDDRTDSGRLRKLIHDLVKHITLTNGKVDLEYNYSFS